MIQNFPKIPPLFVLDWKGKFSSTITLHTKDARLIVFFYCCYFFVFLDTKNN